MSVVDFERARIEAYFSHLASWLGCVQNAQAVCIAHMVPNSVHFLTAVTKVIPVGLVLPKPKSVSRPEYGLICERFKTHELTRQWARDVPRVLDALDKAGLAGKRLVIADIGGYFAPSIDELTKKFSGDILGVVEGTENGAQKYEEQDEIEATVVTVARSPLKLPEDFLVASSVIFSVEAILREQSQILQTRSACVIGYGRVGRGIADVLRGRGIPTVIHDINPIALAEATARGFHAFRRLDEALLRSNLIVCATGNRALDKFGFASLKSGTVVASVTSSDDELDMNALTIAYNPTKISATITRYDEGGTEGGSRYFWLINEGNAANFVHGAVIGPAIQLIEGEKLTALHELATAGASQRSNVIGAASHLQELTSSLRRSVAEIWNDHFLYD